MAHVYKRGKKWAVRFSKREFKLEKQPDGSVKRVKKLSQKQKGGFKTKAEATNYGIIQEAKFKQGLSIDKTPSLVEYFDKWFNTYRKPHLRPGSIKIYEGKKSVIEEYFQDEKITDIDRAQYQDFINWFGKDHYLATVRLLNTLVRSCIKSAIADKIIWSDFTYDVTLTCKKKKRDVTYPNVEEFEKLIQTVYDHRHSFFPTDYVILCAAYTGMRYGEIIGLKWKDIDYMKGIISVKRQYSIERKRDEKLKTDGSNRKIGVPQDFLDTINELSGNNPEYIFWDKWTKLPPNRSTVSSNLKKRIKEAGLDLPGFHFHSLRHSHVYYLKHQGIDIQLTSQRLGHTNSKITEDVYDYETQDQIIKDQEKIANKLEKSGL